MGLPTIVSSREMQRGPSWSFPSLEALPGLTLTKRKPRSLRRTQRAGAGVPWRELLVPARIGCPDPVRWGDGSSLDPISVH